MSLTAELETYKAKLPDLIKDTGKFVLIHGTEVAGTFVAYEDALKEGYEKFGLTPFLVKRIQVTEQIQFISRPMPQCHTSLAK